MNVFMNGLLLTAFFMFSSFTMLCYAWLFSVLCSYLEFSSICTRLNIIMFCFDHPFLILESSAMAAKNFLFGGKICHEYAFHIIHQRSSKDGVVSVFFTRNPTSSNNNSINIFLVLDSRGIDN